MILKYSGTKLQKNNAGVTLVELIVAFSVGLIVAGAIASIIYISTRLYSRESTNISGQYEIQTTLNQTVDSIESAQWFSYKQDMIGSNAVNTAYIALGKISKDATGYYFEGEIYTDDYDGVKDRFNVYMNRYNATNRLSIAAPGANTLEQNAKTAVESAYPSIKTDQYLLGQDATKYIVSLDIGSNRFSGGYYENPLIFNVEIDFSKRSMTGEVKKHVEDTVTLRNHLNKSLYIEELGGYYKPKE